jgi:hypothetical protein
LECRFRWIYGKNESSPFKQLKIKRKDRSFKELTVLLSLEKGVKMGFIRERKLKNGSTRFQAEIRLKGISKSLTAVFDRKTDAKAWIQKVEGDIRCGR